MKTRILFVGLLTVISAILLAACGGLIPKTGQDSVSAQQTQVMATVSMADTAGFRNHGRSGHPAVAADAAAHRHADRHAGAHDYRATHAGYHTRSAIADGGANPAAHCDPAALQFGRI